eukprot:1373317-Prymnesium_polylepis.1
MQRMKLQRVVSSSLTRTVICRMKCSPTELKLFCATEPRLAATFLDDADSIASVACAAAAGVHVVAALQKTRWW